MSSGRTPLPTHASRPTPLVVRSTVPDGLPYNEYRPTLRIDFLYSCAYCTISESEATAIRFTIDHYEPKRARPDLSNNYSNLMYCCDSCNQYKGDRVPSDKARASGIRYFRPDTDRRSEHFTTSGVRIEGQTEIAEFTILTVNLNRLALRKLREIRKRLTDCDRRVADGIIALRNFPFDRLPADIKGKAATAIAKAESIGAALAKDVETLLRTNARSPLDDDTEETRHEADLEAKKRIKEMEAFEALYPGKWRARV